MVDHEFFNRMAKREEEIERNGGDGPFTDDMVRQMLAVRKMQGEIITHMEEMAQKLAAAGVASYTVLKHSPEYAVDQWCEVIRKRAHELVKEKMASVREAKRIEMQKRPEQK